jgi:hypothetical protein
MMPECVNPILSILPQRFLNLFRFGVFIEFRPREGILVRWILKYLHRLFLDPNFSRKRVATETI